MEIDVLTVQPALIEAAGLRNEFPPMERSTDGDVVLAEETGQLLITLPSRHLADPPVSTHCIEERHPGDDSVELRRSIEHAGLNRQFLRV